MTVHTDTKSDASAVLERTRELVLPGLRDVIARLEPSLAAAAGYHFGWLTSEGDSATEEHGKLIRPALTLLAAEAVGGVATSVLPGAVAVELVHNFSLIHDDIMDRDELRRGRPTLWHCLGTPCAILVGDALQALAFEVLCEQESRRPAQLLSTAMRELVSGQARDMAFSDRPWQGADAVSVDEYRAMAMAKTGALMSAALAIGAELGGGPPEVVTTFVAVGRHLGLAFQCMDDILGIWGDTSVTGKPVLGDLREGKKTLPLLGSAAYPDGQEVAAALARRHDSEPALTKLAALVDQAGGLRLAQQEVARQIEHTRGLLASVAMPTATRGQFAALCEAMVGRVR